MTVHDLSPWLDTAWHPRGSVVRRRTPAMIRLGSATLIITPTSRVRTEVVEHLGVHPSRIAVVPEAPSSRIRPVHCSSATAPYLLCVGTIEPRKNLMLAVETWRLLREETGLRLLIAGRDRGDGAAPLPEPGLELLGQVSDERLGCLYAGATAVLYPSSYEGFGLPVLEAMQCGAIVVTGPDPALHEVAGGAAVRVESLDAHDWAEALRTVLANQDLCSVLRAIGRKRAESFTWRRTAIETREVYAEAIRRF
jgi:alpha-1,3-rhamnosyl/mannosyltransferase